MDSSWYGNHNLDRMRAAGGFSNKHSRVKLAVMINKLRNQGLSHYEIQNALKNYGIDVDTTTIRLISNS